MAADVRSVLPENLNEVENKSLFGAFFELKGLKFKKFQKICSQIQSKNSNQKARLKQIVEPSLSLTV